MGPYRSVGQVTDGLVQIRFVRVLPLSVRQAQFLLVDVEVLICFVASEPHWISQFWLRELQSWEASWKSKSFLGPSCSVGQVTGDLLARDQFCFSTFASG